MGWGIQSLLSVIDYSLFQHTDMESLGKVPLTEVSRRGLEKVADVGESYFMCLPCMPASYREKRTSRKAFWTIAFMFGLGM